MAIDFAGFAKMVDALGGVEVCSTTPLEDYELGTVLPTAGRQMVDGHTALNYVRARQVTTEYNGDYGRIKRQQMFLSSLLRSLISKDTFFSLSKLNNVVNMFINDSYVDNIQTKDLVDLGQSIQGVSAGRVTFVTVPTTGITDDDGNEVPDARGHPRAVRRDHQRRPATRRERQERDHHPGDHRVRGAHQDRPRRRPVKRPLKRPSPRSRPTEVVNAVTTEPHDITVHVSNSTGREGLGSTASHRTAAARFQRRRPR